MHIDWDFGVWTPSGSQRLQSAFYKAAKKSGGDAIRAMRAEAKRQIRANSAIKASFLSDKALRLEFPQGPGLDALVWTMRVSGKPVPLENFPHRQVKAGVKVKVYGGVWKLIKSAFIASTRGGGEGVFRRPGAARYPMGHKLGPRVSDTMDHEPLIEAVRLRSQDVFRSAFARLLPMELGKIR